MVGDMLLQQTLRLAASGHHPRSVARRILYHRVGSVFDFHLITYVSGSLFIATASVWTLNAYDSWIMITWANAELNLKQGS
jgi:hypothetical protein